MKHFIYIITIIIVGLASYWVGCQTWIVDNNNKIHHFNTEEARLEEVKYSNAMFEALHHFYERDTTYWNNEFKNTYEYKGLEEANNGDWEDFYTEWDKPLKQ